MYFISYQWSRPGESWVPGHLIIDQHPLEWLYETNKEPETYHLLWWTELKEYDRQFVRDDDDLPLT